MSDAEVTIFGTCDYVVQMLWNYTYLNVGQVIKLSSKSIVSNDGLSLSPIFQVQRSGELKHGF